MINENEVREMRQQGDWRAYMLTVQEDIQYDLKRRRAAVLRYPDLALKLTEGPCRFSTPEAWSGYVPSATVEEKHTQRRNTSPYRAQLVAIVVEAQMRDGKDYGVTGE